MEKHLAASNAFKEHDKAKMKIIHNWFDIFSLSSS